MSSQQKQFQGAAIGNGVFGRTLAIVLAASLALPAPVFAKNAPRPRVEKVGHAFLNHPLLRSVNAEIEKNPAFYYRDAELSTSQAIENKGYALVETEAVIRKLEDDSIPMEEVKRDLIRLALAEEEAQAIELKYLVRKMPSETVASLTESALKSGLYPRELNQRYRTLYTLNERQAFLQELLRSELGQIRSVTLKRIGKMDRADLLNELRTTRTLLGSKSKEKWKIVLIVAISVAAAGFVSWAVISATQKKYDRKTRDADRDHQKRSDDLKKTWQTKEDELQAIYDARAKLRDEGYVWTVCGTSTRNVSIACSYDFTRHSGPEQCVTRCMRQPQTGQEALHETSCSSAFVPNNCLVKNPYVAGYETGYGSGYDEGYATSYDRAYQEAYRDYYQPNYNRGYDAAYDTGYNAGYTAGVDQAAYDDSQDDDSGGGDDCWPWCGGDDDDSDDDDDWGGGDDDDDSGGDDDWGGGDDDDWDDGYGGFLRAGQRLEPAQPTTPSGLQSSYQKGYREGYSQAQLLRIGL